MSNLSSLAHAYGTNKPFAALSQQGQQQDQETPQAPGSAASVRSTLSVGAVERRARLVAAYEASVERLTVEMEDQIRLEDERSDAAKQEQQSVKLEQPTGSAKNTEAAVIERELVELDERRVTLARILASKQDAKLLPPSPPLSTASSLSLELRPLATTSHRAKVTTPEKGKGVFDYVEREAWIKSMEGHFASLELDLSARVDSSLTPLPYHLIRSSFSTAATHGGLSAIAWFDARDRRSPFTSVQQVFDAVRSHWRDDTAADVALDAYRGARQGSLRARDFGSQVETLADRVFTCTFDEDDRMATFTRGLNTTYHDGLRMEVVRAERVGTAPTTLTDLVDLVAVADGFDAFAASLSKGRGGSTSATTGNGGRKGTTGSDAPVDKAKGETPSSYEEKPFAWRTRANEWQARFPVASRGDWASDGAQKPRRR